MKNPTTKTRTPAQTKDEPIALRPVERPTLSIIPQVLFPSGEEPADVANELDFIVNELRVVEAAVMVDDSYDLPREDVMYTIARIHGRLREQHDRLEAMQARWVDYRDGKAVAS